MLLGKVEHQGHAQRLIQRALLAERLPHAYLFHGPDGIGKEKLAMGLAQLLLCQNPVDKALDADQAATVGLEQLRGGCGKCEDCVAVVSGAHPDLHLIFRQLNREHPDPEVRKRKGLDIGVDVLRHFVIEKVGLTPMRGRAKVFILREADRITPQAQNAMLKTLEEPPGTTYLMLLVNTLDRLLPTTLSRCQVLRFDVLPASFVREKLDSLTSDVAPEELDWYARSSDGSLGLALEQVADDWFSLNRRVLAGLAGLCGDGRSVPDAIGVGLKSWTDAAKALGDRYRKRDPDITDTEASRRGLKTLFRLAAVWYADVLRVGSGDGAAVVNLAQADQIDRAAKVMSVQSAGDVINRLAQAERHLDLNANTQLCVETLLNDLERAARGAPLLA